MTSVAIGATTQLVLCLLARSSIHEIAPCAVEHETTSGAVHRSWYRRA